jgi:hypothetical protein
VTAPALDLARMREVLAKCTPGTWKLWGMQVMSDQIGSGEVDDAVLVARCASADLDRLRTWNAEHIRLTQPQYAVRMIEALERTEALRAEWAESAAHPSVSEVDFPALAERMARELGEALAPLREGWGS